MNIISRKNAQVDGVKRYFTGVPCIHGHLSERLVSNSSCCECTRLAMKAYRDKHMKTGFPRGRPRKGEVRPPSPNAIRTAEYRKARLANDPEFRKTLNAYNKKWREENPERWKEIGREKNQRRKERENGD